MITKGIILAGGTGSRLAPMTRTISKQLLPIYDKPMIYYPLTTLMLAGIRDILLITTPQDQRLFIELLGDGTQWGCQFTYRMQPQPEGIAQALLIGESFLAGEGCALILGDNLFYGEGLSSTLQSAAAQESGATIFTYWVKDPERYGIVEYDAAGEPVRIVEKPVAPASPFAVTGLYFYDREVIALARTLQPSARGELEISELNHAYLQRGTLRVEAFGRGTAWLDTGTPEALLDAATFIAILEKRQGLKIGCPEEVAYRMGFITAGELSRLLATYPDNAYRGYLERLVGEAAVGIGSG